MVKANVAPDHDTVDLLVIGGGVNGAGIARDAAGRGLSVVLCEKDDLAQGTSSRSGKLIHGGLRYLEYYEFRLVREALIEREVLLEMLPHISWPMRFVLPHNQEQRPAWLVRTGLFLYDHLGGRKRLLGTRSLDLCSAPEGKPLKPQFKKAFEYSDCWVDDARLVVLNAQSAARKGAVILTRTAFTVARREGGVWRAELTEARSGATRVVHARAIVNAAGPWVEDVVERRIRSGAAKHRVRLVKGSHIIVPKFWEGRQAYLIQHSDRRVIFINPYEGDYALIGTTDIPYQGDAEEVRIDEAEIQYLCAAVNRYFKQQLAPRDVVHAFSGVRPLFDDDAQNPSAVTRDYFFELDGDASTPVLLSIFGGKITTYRKLSEHALEKLKPYLPKMGPAWTSREPLPGGDMADFDEYLKRFHAERPWLPAALAEHYLRCYGTAAQQLLGDAGSLAALGVHFGACLYEREVRYLIEEEWAEETDDVLWRRTKYGLHMTPPERDAFAQWMQALPRLGAQAPAGIKAS